MKQYEQLFKKEMEMFKMGMGYKTLWGGFVKLFLNKIATLQVTSIIIHYYLTTDCIEL